MSDPIGMTREEFQAAVDPSPEDMSTEQHIRALTAENNRLKRQTGADSRLFAAVRDELTILEPSAPVSYAVPSLAHDPLYPALIVTDVHAEEVVLAEEMEGLAHHDWNVCQARMSMTVEKTLELVNIQRQASVIEELQIWSLGDWFNGMIQPQEGAYGISMPMPRAIPAVSIAFAHMVASLAPHFKRIKVVGMCGNHGRTTKKPVFKATADRNWDMAVYLVAQAICANLENVAWELPNAIMHVSDIAGWNALLTHSGEVNMNNRTPYYPIESTFDQEHKARRGTGKDFTYAFMGHWHHWAILDNNIVLCPSMIGANQFSRFRLHKRSTPEQLLTFFTEKHGMIQMQPIKLLDADR